MTSNGPSIRRAVIVANPPMGLHMRPATLFVKTARQFKCKVTVLLGDQKANGHSPFDLLSLFAPPGTELILEIEGDDCEAAGDALAAILTISEVEDTPPPFH